MQIPEALVAQNEVQFTELVAQLKQEEAQFSVAVFDHADLRDELIEAAIANHPEFQPILLDLGKTVVSSFTETLAAKLPPELMETTDLFAVVHTVNLEGTLLSETLSGEAQLLASLETDLSALHSQYPFHHVLWVDRYFYEQIENSLPEAVSRYPFQSGKAPSTNAYEQLKVHQEAISQGEAATGLSGTFAAIGKIMQEASRPQEASIYFEKALEAGQIAGDEKALADAYLGIGNLLIADQDLMQAMDNYEIALEKYLALGDKAGEIEARIWLARIVGQTGSYADAITHQKQVVEWFTQQNDLEAIGLNARRLAHFYERKGEMAETFATYELAAQTYLQLENFAESARSWQQIGGIRQARLEWAPALEAFQNALPAAQKSGDEYLLHAVEDSIEDMQSKVKKPKSGDSGKKKGFFGKLFG